VPALALATARDFVQAIEKSVSNRNKLIRVNRRQLTAGLAADAATELGPELPRRSAPAVGNIGMRPERGRAPHFDVSACRSFKTAVVPARPIQ
jgi:hypothetical protein